MSGSTHFIELLRLWLPDYELYVFDSLKRTYSSESFVQESDLTGRVECFVLYIYIQ